MVVTSNNKKLMEFIRSNGILRKIRKRGISAIGEVDCQNIGLAFGISKRESVVKIWLSNELDIRERKKRKKESLGTLLSKRITTYNNQRIQDRDNFLISKI